ncbi:anthocyanidin 5,3-O-glucosyltransferase-like [Phalaenopsis equestris]|uniref:anthocyanidin 5,3-O-glucosyltransferase-like n=1 Tax=Phalaenopsis equestris TaxID=78828 RepID=UPI0009E24532|nr:anthocyanidin 5,3-O-glucosyltransferase-like [Phalaenopsis equestris]
MGKEIIMFPLAAMGHLNPMVELGKLLIRHASISITILISQSPSIDNKPIDSYISRVSSAHPHIFFHRLPPVPQSSNSKTATFLDHFHLTIPYLKTYLSASSAHAIILDFFFDAALEVANEFHLPCYYFFASNASNLAAFLYLPTLHNQLNASFKDLGDNPIHFPGFPSPIPASDMPIRISDRTSETYKAAIVQFERLAKSSGIIVNSFQSLEPKALRALANGDCFPGRPMAPVYFVGPITANDVEDKDSSNEFRHESLAWLDGQPGGSVVFLCFGSMGSGISEEQNREIAVGLERSGQRFLWVVRRSQPAAAASGITVLTKKEQDLEAVLPEGFLERTKGRGLVVQSWAPQVAVLRHPAVGGFVTHCGWNSALESIVAGVAMIAWPFYAEQRMNKVFLVEEAKLAVEMRGYKNGIVVSDEIEERVRWLMKSEGGKELRARAAVVGESGRAALQEGGSSYKTMVEIVRLVNNIGGGELGCSGEQR